MPTHPPTPAGLHTVSEVLTSVPAGSTRPWTARSFETLEEMNEFQWEAEAREALRVKGMSGWERARWLEQNWDPLQRQFSKLCAGVDLGEVPRTVQFSTMEAKNAYDEERELRLALAIRAKLGF